MRGQTCKPFAGGAGSVAQLIEKGDVYFFYRNKAGVTRVHDLNDVQRLFMVMVPDGLRRKARMFLVGRKRLPRVNGRSAAREWMMNVMSATPDRIGRELAPAEYRTRVLGRRRVAQAFPVGEARYALVENEGQTEFSYRLVRPQQPGKAQRALGLRREAAYVITVRNPAAHMRGFPDDRPGYPRALRKLFGGRRFIGLSQASLLDYENAQLLLLNAREEPAIPIPGRPPLSGKPAALDLRRWPEDALLYGRFPGSRDEQAAEVTRRRRGKPGAQRRPDPDMTRPPVKARPRH